MSAAPDDLTRIRKLYDDLSFSHIHNDEPGGPSLYRLDLLTSIIESAEAARAKYVARAREEGASWTRIGQNVGTSKQAAAKRWGAPSPKVDDGQMTIGE